MEKIKVAIRTRPIIEREELEEGRNNWRVQNNTICQLNGVGKVLPNTNYSFDYVYDQTAPTTLLYDQLVAPIVQSVVEGFNGTVFAYGQTSSGKTYTMMGAPELPGIIPFTFTGLFKHIELSNNCEFVLRLSYMEIYNESIMDLLNPGNTNLIIRETDARIPYVANLTEAHITDFSSIDLCLINGERNRHTGKTNMNERSSRSHTLLRLILESKMGDEGTIKVSHLNLVDLAGSERASATTGDGARFKEGTFINRSLLTLGTVIRRLSEAKKDSHIPYRDSKLTRILESSLGGNAKTVIICTVTTTSIEETHSTLRFASRAKSVENHAVVNEYSDDSDVDIMLKRLKRLEKENLDLKKKLSEDTSCRSQLQDMESKISSLKSLVIRSNTSLTEVIDYTHPTRRYTMGAFPDKRAMDLKRIDRVQLSPNLDIARRMMNNSQAEFRRRRGMFEPIKIQLNNVFEEKENLTEEESSLYSRNSDCTQSLSIGSPAQRFSVSSNDNDSIELTPNNRIKLHEYKLELVSTSTQTLSDNTTDNTVSREYADAIVQTEYESSPIPCVQDSSFQTSLVYNNSYNNSSVLIQTECIEDTISYLNTDISLTQVTELIDTQSATTLCQDNSMQTVSEVLYSTDDTEVTPLLYVDATIQTDNFSLSQTITDTNTIISIQTENAEYSSPIHPKHIYLQTDDVITIDTQSSPFAVHTHSALTQFPDESATTDTYMQTECMAIIPLHYTSIQTEEIVNPIHFLECCTQTDYDDVITSDASMNTSIIADTNCIVVLEQRNVAIQTSPYEHQVNQATQAVPPTCPCDIISTQSQTEFEISEILNDPTSLPKENRSFITEKFEDILIQTTNSSIQTEYIQHCSTATNTDILICDKSTNSTQTVETPPVYDYSAYLDETHNETIIFDLSSKLCDIEAKNEELVLELECSLISNCNLMQIKKCFEEVVYNILTEDEFNLNTGSIKQLTEDLHSPETTDLIDSLLQRIIKYRREISKKELVSSDEASNIEDIERMVCNWSQEDLQQLPHYLASIQTEIQKMNTVISSKDSCISELRTQIDTVSCQLTESQSRLVNTQNAHSQTQLDLDGDATEEIEQLKTSNQGLRAQLSQSEVKIREYSSLLLEQDKPVIKTDASVMTNEIAILSVVERNKIDNTLNDVNALLSQLTEVRGRAYKDLSTEPIDTFEGFSNIYPFLEQVTDVIKGYVRDLEMLIDVRNNIEEERESNNSFREQAAKLKSEMEHQLNRQLFLQKEQISDLQSQLDADKIHKQKAQSHMNSAMDEISDLFKTNDLLDQQVKILEKDKQKRTMDWENEKSTLEMRLLDDNKNIEELEIQVKEANTQSTQLRTEVTELTASLDHYKDHVHRSNIEVIANKLVEIERDNSSLQSKNQTLSATRSHLDGVILHLKTQIESDRLDKMTLEKELNKLDQELQQALTRISELEHEHNSGEVDKSTEMEVLRNRVQELETTLKDCQQDSLNIKSDFDEKSADFDEIRNDFRRLKKRLVYLTMEGVPHLQSSIYELETEVKTLKESESSLQSQLEEARENLKSKESNSIDFSLSNDKLNVSELKSKLRFYEKQFGNQQRKISFLEDQCRNVERRRQLEVSEMPKHDYLSLRADRASLKAQARTSSKPSVVCRDELEVNSEQNIPINKQTNAQDSINDCNTQ